LEKENIIKIFDKKLEKKLQEQKEQITTIQKRQTKQKEKQE
jgi:hypothetical protein